MGKYVIAAVDAIALVAFCKMFGLGMGAVTWCAYFVIVEVVSAALKKSS